MTHFEIDEIYWCICVDEGFDCISAYHCEQYSGGYYFTTYHFGDREARFVALLNSAVYERRICEELSLLFP